MDGLFSWQNFWSKSLCLRYTEEPNGSVMGFVMVGEIEQWENIESVVFVLLCSMRFDSEDRMSEVLLNGNCRVFSRILPILMENLWGNTEWY